MRAHALDHELTVVPRSAVTFPVRVPPPLGFDAPVEDTWPRSPGRWEWVKGELLYMTPCGDDQQQTAMDVAGELSTWRRQHQEFIVACNEAGMMLGGDVRGADAAAWHADDLGSNTGGFPRTPPVLAIEITGRDEPLDALREKAEWYRSHGVAVVWLVDVASRSVHVIDERGERRVGPGERVPEHAELPGLSPLVDDLFQQVSRA